MKKVLVVTTQLVRREKNPRAFKKFAFDQAVKFVSDVGAMSRMRMCVFPSLTPLFLRTWGLCY